MRERSLICANCGQKFPSRRKVKSCPDCDHSLVPIFGGIRTSFAITLFLVTLLWVITPILMWMRPYDPESGYGREFSPVLGSGMYFVLYAFIGLIVGLVMLRAYKPIGVGILAGTGLGLLIGFTTCFAIGAVVV